MRGQRIIVVVIALSLGSLSAQSPKIITDCVKMFTAITKDQNKAYLHVVNKNWSKARKWSSKRQYGRQDLVKNLLNEDKCKPAVIQVNNYLAMFIKSVDKIFEAQTSLCNFFTCKDEIMQDLAMTDISLPSLNKEIELMRDDKLTKAIPEYIKKYELQSTFDKKFIEHLSSTRDTFFEKAQKIQSLLQQEVKTYKDMKE